MSIYIVLYLKRCIFGKDFENESLIVRIKSQNLSFLNIKTSNQWLYFALLTFKNGLMTIVIF